MQFYIGIIAISRQLIHFSLTSQRHHFYTIHRLVLSFLIVAFVEPSFVIFFENLAGVVELIFLGDYLQRQLLQMKSVSAVKSKKDQTDYGRCGTSAKFDDRLIKEFGPIASIQNSCNLLFSTESCSIPLLHT
ncbi:hypothetical protein T02_6278 [Trichinella nativa]|uniref:Uncharacterized protein n=1 Tax=Trichinella nativa TaxID=6335 RepID=A0A0V1LE84_9BILA|nr:hypothetical protein T02_6278 [Trichinella nativa]